MTTGVERVDDDTHHSGGRVDDDTHHSGGRWPLQRDELVKMPTTVGEVDEVLHHSEGMGL